MSERKRSNKTVLTDCIATVIGGIFLLGLALHFFQAYTRLTIVILEIIISVSLLNSNKKRRISLNTNIDSLSGVEFEDYCVSVIKILKNIEGVMYIRLKHLETLELI